MGGIFISYRREDSGPYAGRLRDTLSRRFGAEQVFRDVDRIDPGERFPRVIEEAAGSCDALLALIGPTWQAITDDAGQRRLDNPDDFVRLEIAAALGRADVLVIPVLVGTTTMPDAAELPAPLASLAERNAIRVTDDNWDDQVARLTRALDKVIQRPVTAPSRESQMSQPPPQSARSRPAVPIGIAVAVVAVVVLGLLAVVAQKAISGGSRAGGDAGLASPTVVVSPSTLPPPTTTPTITTTTALPVACGTNIDAPEVGVALSTFDKNDPAFAPEGVNQFAGNFDPCATLSTVLIYPYGGSVSTPRHALMFHHGEYLGTATPNPYAFMEFNAEQTTDSAVVLNFRHSEASCNACDDASAVAVKFRWNGAGFDMVGTPPDTYRA